MAIKMNATSYATNRDFRNTVDIRQKIKQGTKTRTIHLPPEDFAYGLPNRASTPIKEVINGEYGNRAERNIRKEYGNYLDEKSRYRAGPPKVVCKYVNPKAAELKAREEEKRREKELDDNLQNLDEDPIMPVDTKPLYKLKMFDNIKSKVIDDIKAFKTYKPYKKKKDNLDQMIENVQREINEAQKAKMQENS